MLKNKMDGTIVLVQAFEEFDEDEWTRFWLVHDLPSFISLHLSVMHENKDLVVDLETGADENGCIGSFPSTYLGIWGDGMDGTGKHKSISQAGIVLHRRWVMSTASTKEPVVYPLSTAAAAPPRTPNDGKFVRSDSRTAAFSTCELAQTATSRALLVMPRISPK